MFMLQKEGYILYGDPPFIPMPLHITAISSNGLPWIFVHGIFIFNLGSRLTAQSVCYFYIIYKKILHREHTQRVFPLYTTNLETGDDHI